MVCRLEMAPSNLHRSSSWRSIIDALQVTVLRSSSSVLLKSHFINCLQLVREVLKDLWVCPPSMNLSTASKDRLIILHFTQWNYKLFIPSQKKELNIWKLNAACRSLMLFLQKWNSDSSLMRCCHDLSLTGSPALLKACTRLGLWGKTGCWESHRLLSALPIFPEQGP